MINVCQVVSDTNIGGAGRYLINYLKYFDRDNFDVTVIIPENSSLKAMLCEFSDIDVREVPYMADKSYDSRCVGEIRKILREKKTDIVHTHASLSARVAARKEKVRAIIATRHCIEENGGSLLDKVKSVLNNLLCDKYVAVSHAVYENLLNCGIKKDKITNIPNGVEPVLSLTEEEIVKAKEKYGINNEMVFGIFARLEEIKGHKYFIEGAKKLLDEGLKAKFLVVGDGSLREELIKLSEGYKDIIFTGYVEDTAELLNITDVNVLSSKSEAMSLAILEAMSLKKPTIATNVGGNPQLIKNGKNGILTEYQDAEGLKNAFIKFLADKCFYDKCAQTAEEMYKEQFTAEIMVKNLETLYEEVSK